MPLRNEEVLPAIIVVIEQMRAPTGKSESRSTHARRVGHILEGAFAVVVKEVIAFIGKIRDDNVRATVIVVIAEVGPHPGKRFSVRIIVIEDVRDALKIVGVTIGPQAGFLSSTIAVVPEAPIHITCHEEVEVAVIVVIEKPGARTPSASDNSGAFRYVSERAVGVLIIEPVPEPAIGLVRKLAVRHRIVDLRAVGEEDVQPPIVVIVQRATPPPMASTKYLLEVAEFSCLKSMFVGRVISVNCTSGPAVAAVTQKKSPNDTTQRRAFEYLLMVCLSNPPVANNSFAFLQDRKSDWRAS